MKFFLIAGEPSGDKLGAALMAGLKELAPGVEFHGIGGPLMEAEGLTSRFPMEELSVMGLLEVLPKYRHLKRRIAETAAAVADLVPDALITIDSPDFTLRVAKAARAVRPRSAHHSLCRALGLGVASGPGCPYGAGDRSCAGAFAL